MCLSNKHKIALSQQLFSWNVSEFMRVPCLVNGNIRVYNHMMSAQNIFCCRFYLCVGNRTGSAKNELNARKRAFLSEFFYSFYFICEQWNSFILKHISFYVDLVLFLYALSRAFYDNPTFQTHFFHSFSVFAGRNILHLTTHFSMPPHWIVVTFDVVEKHCNFEILCILIPTHYFKWFHGKINQKKTSSISCLLSHFLLINFHSTTVECDESPEML